MCACKIGGNGASTSTTRNNQGSLKLLGLFINSGTCKSLAGHRGANPEKLEFKKLPPDLVAQNMFWEELAGFLVHIYQIPIGIKHAGQQLGVNTIDGHFKRMLRIADETFSPG